VVGVCGNPASVEAEPALLCVDECFPIHVEMTRTLKEIHVRVMEVAGPLYPQILFGVHLGPLYPQILSGVNLEKGMYARGVVRPLADDGRKG
jgi:hypothetical protein